MNKIIWITALAFASSGAWGMNKCIGADGKVSYTDQACPEKSKSAGFTSAPAAASATPEDVFLQCERAIQAEDFAALTACISTKSRSKMPTESGEKLRQTMKLMKTMSPTGVKVTHKEISKDGATATLKATGTGTNFMTNLPEPMFANVTLVKEGGQWKVNEQSWSVNPTVIK